MIKYKINKIIFSSTASVYGEPKKIPIKESYKCKPISVYGKSKLLAENLIKKNQRIDLSTLYLDILMLLAH